METYYQGDSHRAILVSIHEAHDCHLHTESLIFIITIEQESNHTFTSNI